MLHTYLHILFSSMAAAATPLPNRPRLMHISPSHSRGLAIDKALPHIGAHIVPKSP